MRGSSGFLVGDGERVQGKVENKSRIGASSHTERAAGVRSSIHGSLSVECACACVRGIKSAAGANTVAFSLQATWRCV